MTTATCTIRAANEGDVPAILGLIRELADYEKLRHEVTATAEQLHEHLFGPHPAAEVLIADVAGEAAGFALFFTNFSTFLGRPGIYLEDLFVKPPQRGRGIGKALLRELARLVVARQGGRLDWSVLDWNDPAITFYKSQGAIAMDEWTGFRLSGEALQRFAAGDTNG